MGKALYRKYRSKRLGEIVGQEHITTTLEKALASGRISHAYLFSGPRGVGKTSIARILAHEINGLPYEDDAAHLDIIEIDAASNRRIDEIRDLRDKVHIAPTSSKYKVYIIDEVHMLTREAFNALLKTLEEPPAHAVFILATTEAHKLPETIVSRTQHYTFKPVEQQKVIDHLAHIAREEKITITPEALALLAMHGEGSFRDSISLLDQAGSIGDQIDEAQVRQLLGIAPEAAIDGLIHSLQTAERAVGILGDLQELYGSGLRAASIASQLAGKLRSALAAGKPKPLLPVSTTLRLLRELIDVPASHNPERLLEIVLLDAAGIAGTPAAAPVISAPTAVVTPRPQAQSLPQTPLVTPPKQTAPPQPAVPAPTAQKSTPVQHAPVPAAAAEEIVVTAVVAGPVEIRALDDTVWPDILTNIKKQYNTLYGVLRMAQPVFSDDSLELQFNFAFHQKRINEVKNKQIVADFIKQATGRDILVQCTVNKAASPSPGAAASAGANSPPPAGTPELESISNIFGGGEVL
ncbi:MAG TPA: DNA polymerase III subunit gamma/tau [Candidatus Saccharimonadales bacterium]|nr:DNA polymerase III subunit gamma/tau [Candidatus Saccharimonadales bacterium]